MTLQACAKNQPRIYTVNPSPAPFTKDLFEALTDRLRLKQLDIVLVIDTKAFCNSRIHLDEDGEHYNQAWRMNEFVLNTWASANWSKLAGRGLEKLNIRLRSSSSSIISDEQSEEMIKGIREVVGCGGDDDDEACTVRYDNSLRGMPSGTQLRYYSHEPVVELIEE